MDSWFMARSCGSSLLQATQWLVAAGEGVISTTGTARVLVQVHVFLQQRGRCVPVIKRAVQNCTCVKPSSLLQLLFLLKHNKAT
jgi:hypothetical protein